MLQYVAKLTRTPAAMVIGDVTALREAGFDDRAILDINQITGFFAWCNRTVDGLGVELENYWDEAARELSGHESGTPPARPRKPS